MKDKILEWLFKGYTKKLRDHAKELAELQFEAYKRSLDIKDLIRERYAGVRPQHPENDTVINEHLASLTDDVSRLAFLAKAKDLTNNEAFKVIKESIIVEAQKQASFYSPDMVDVNFNRATLNGIMLMEEEAEKLTALYIKEKEASDKMSDEERLSAL